MDCNILLKIFIYIFLINIQDIHSTKCIKDKSVISNTAKYIHYNGEIISLKLATSKRISHQLTTNIFKIFVEEILGYSGVEIIEIEDNFELAVAFQSLTVVDKGDVSKNIPEVLVNLEVWVPPEVDIINVFDANNLKEFGNIFPSGRFGWYIPRKLLHPSIVAATNESPILDVHWSIFKKLKYAQYFSVSDQWMKYILPYAQKVNCDNCINNIYTPKQCQRNEDCALVFSSYYEDTKFIFEYFDEYKLFVKIIWLGEHLKNISDFIVDSYVKQNVDKSLVLFHWTPSEIISPESSFLRVSFPSCNILDNHKTDEQIDCRYDSIRMVKIGWERLKTIAVPIYGALQYITFDQNQMTDLFTIYNQQTKSIEQIACDWLNNNSKIVKSWNYRPDDLIKINIGGIFPLTGYTSVAYTGTGILVAANMAVDAINKSPLLKGYSLELLPHDGQCRSDKVMQKFIDIIKYENLLGVLGPACSETVEPLAGVSKYYTTVIISYSAEGVSFQDRNKYPYFFRTIGENKHYNPVYLQFFKRLGWTRVAALAEDGQKYTEYISNLQDLLENNEISFILNKKFTSDVDHNTMRKYLEDLKQKRSKIIIGDVYDEMARSVMCQAYRLNMTAKHGYVWFLPMWLAKDWFDTNKFNLRNNESVPCSTHMMLDSINYHLSLSHASFAEEYQMMQENITVGEWKKKYVSRCKMSYNGTETSIFGGYAYDAMWTYAYALHNLIEQDPKSVATLHSYNTTIKLVDFITKTNFNGVSGLINFHGGPSRISVININQWINNTHFLIGQYYPNVSESMQTLHGSIFNGTLNLNLSAIKWATGFIPNDGRESAHKCILGDLADVLDVECEVAIVILNIIFFGVLGVVVIAAIYVVKSRYDRKVQMQQKYFQSLGLKLFDKNLFDLDKWELPRERLIMNRKLGEGAFGTVYGGEARLDDNRWVGVAVKTLKVGSSNEEKLDFLSEAEIMKRFDHKNIVKLLGVCTQSEPVFTVMELMLYGDLKTYLLARRHLVKEKNWEDNDEISSKRLTLMTLDVARALSYLATLKFVHRDVACRNCLVNERRVVKLGDFGMTRPMFENDYYKFNRRGMLPVRWMAPESLALGIFTPSSDVWSFGVLLYEIVTFGGFPFQGMTNHEVLEHVKAGNVLTVPKKTKPQLEAVMKACWSSDPKRRPQASEIVEFLADHPRLISPSLDIYLQSFQMMDMIDMDTSCTSDALRKCSLLDPPPNETVDLLSTPSMQETTDFLTSVNDPLLNSIDECFNNENQFNLYVIQQHYPLSDTTEC